MPPDGFTVPEPSQLPQDTPKKREDTPPNQVATSPTTAPQENYYTSNPQIVQVTKTNIPLEDEPKPKQKGALPK